MTALTFAHTRRRALDEERAIRLRIPGWQPSPGEGPVAEWETEWLASGFFSSEGECELPETLESVRGVAANGCAVSTVALLCVAPQGEGGTCRVKLRLMVEAPGVVLRPQQQLTEQAQRRPPDWVAYTDGSEDLGKAGWAYAVLIGGDAIGDEGASLTSEGYGPVVTSAAHLQSNRRPSRTRRFNPPLELPSSSQHPDSPQLPQHPFSH